MASILFNGDWFEPLAVTAIYETEFEQIFLANAQHVYPSYYVIPFRLTVEADTEAAKPDFALVHRQYRDWWVVEVEMGNHDLSSHVEPQVRTLSRAVYGRREAEYLCAKEPLLQHDKVLDMMKGRQPRVLVLVNTPRPAWAVTLSRYDALLAILEVFRSERNRYLFRINGDHPPQPVDLVSDCVFDRLLPRFLIIQSPAILTVPPRGRVKLYFEGGITEWERLDIQDRVYLTPLGPNPLNSRSEYHITRLEGGTLRISKKYDE